MKTLTYEGFKIATDMDEARPYTRMYPDGITDDEIIGNNQKVITNVIEQMIIGGQSAVNHFYEHCRGYRQRSLEPYNWRETKQAVTITYTGAMGGDEYKIIIYK